MASEAGEAIESGKIEVNDECPKRGRAVHVGDRVSIRLGPYEHHLVVWALSGKRGPAAVARELYEETADNIAARERTAERLRKGRASHQEESPRLRAPQGRQ